MGAEILAFIEFRILNSLAKRSHYTDCVISVNVRSALWVNIPRRVHKIAKSSW